MVRLFDSKQAVIRRGFTLESHKESTELFVMKFKDMKNTDTPETIFYSDYELEDLLTDKQLAERWSMSTKTLCHMRSLKAGPRFIKIGNSIKYPISEIIKYEREHLYQNTSEYNKHLKGAA